MSLALDHVSTSMFLRGLTALSGLIDKLPQQMAAKAGQADMDRAERDVKRMEGIICSMTPLERRKPDLLKATRKRRIAAGAGVQVQEVNRLLKQYEQMRDMMKKMNINSSAAVASSSAVSPSRTRSGPPITPAARKSLIADRSCGCRLFM